MVVNKIIFIMCIYTAIQYLFSRYTAAKINKEDPAYFNFDEGKFPSWGKGSGAATKIIFDGDLPFKEYAKNLKIMIYAARAVYIFTVPLIIILIWI